MAGFNYLRDFILNPEHCGFQPIKSELIQKVRNNPLPEFKYMEVELPKIGETKEIPMFLFTYITSILRGQSIITDRMDKIGVPILPINALNVRNVSTYPSFVKQWFNYYGLTKYVTVIHLKDEVFYTYPGVIMDANFNILVYISMEILNIAAEINRCEPHKKDINIYISPDVFTSSTTLCRNLIKKFIPEVLNYVDEAKIGGSNLNHNIVIKNVNDLIHTPVAPSTLEVTEEAYFALEQGLSSILQSNEYV